jgi:hypothetical protein
VVTHITGIDKVEELPKAIRLLNKLAPDFEFKVVVNVEVEDWTQGGPIPLVAHILPINREEDVITLSTITL